MLTISKWYTEELTMVGWREGGRAGVNVTKASVMSVHRSLFHPLATSRHRIWAGPEKETKENELLEISNEHKVEVINKISNEILPCLLVYLSPPLL
jgi:hypothetical protein